MFCSCFSAIMNLLQLLEKYERPEIQSHAQYTNLNLSYSIIIVQKAVNTKLFGITWQAFFVCIYRLYFVIAVQIARAASPIWLATWTMWASNNNSGLIYIIVTYLENTVIHLFQPDSLELRGKLLMFQSTTLQGQAGLSQELYNYSWHTDLKVRNVRYRKLKAV